MTKVRINIPIYCDNHDNAEKLVVRHFNRDFGGSSLYECFGTWVDDDGYVVEEPNVVIESFTDISEDDAVDYVKGLAMTVKELTNEMSVMVTVNNDAYSI